jgi:hypothetical protein
MGACSSRPPPQRSGPTRAHDGTRTRDLFLTKEVLYRLSYVSTFAVAGEHPSKVPRRGIEPLFSP